LQPTSKREGEALMGEIRTSLDCFANSHGEPKVRGLLGLGGGFRLHGLLRYLRTKRWSHLSVLRDFERVLQRFLTAVA
jgi:hypothetical protein